MSGSGRGAKRLKVDAPVVDDFYRLAKHLQNRSGASVGAFSIEDRRFREYFGCGASIALLVWTMLGTYDAIPDGGAIIHLLWALYFMKNYPKQEQGSDNAGGSGGAVDRKTWAKHLWPFIFGVSYLEQFVVRYFFGGDFCVQIQLTQTFCEFKTFADRLREPENWPQASKRLQHVRGWG